MSDAKGTCARAREAGWRTVEVDVTRADLDAVIAWADGCRARGYETTSAARYDRLATMLGAPVTARNLLEQQRFEGGRIVYSLAWEEPRS